MRQCIFTARGWIHSVREASCPAAPAWPGQGALYILTLYAFILSFYPVNPSSPLATWCKEPTHWKDPDARKDWRQKEKVMVEDESVGWHHRLSGHEFEQARGVGDGQGSLACCSPWGCRVGHDWATEQQQQAILSWGRQSPFPARVSEELPGLSVLFSTLNPGGGIQPFPTISDASFPLVLLHPTSPTSSPAPEALLGLRALRGPLTMRDPGRRGHSKWPKWPGSLPVVGHSLCSSP